MTKFKVGNKVKITRGTWFINEGKLKWHNEDRIGSTGIIVKANVCQGIDYYSLHPIKVNGVQPFAYAWYNNNDLILDESC